MKKPLASALTVLALAAGLAPSVPAQAAAPDADPTVSRALGAWFATLQGLENGSAGKITRVAWWGDSAVVGDGYTGRLREKLQARFGDAGPGFVLASPTFDGYLRHGVNMSQSGWDAFAVIGGDVKAGNYGYGGVIATSYGGATSSYKTGTPVTAVEIYYQAVPKGGVIQIFVDGAKKSTFTKDTEAASASDQVWRQVLDKPAKSIKVRAGGEGVVKVYGVVLERGTAGVELDALGILGMRARRWLNADQAHLKAQIAARAPDLVVVNFGGNERVDENLSVKAHTDDMTKALTALRAGAPRAACLVVGPLAHGATDGSGAIDENLDTIYAAQKKVAEAQGCAFFDTMAVMGGAKAPKTWLAKKWISGDYAHLTPKGHDHLGDLMADWLLGQYDKWKANHS
ncbi:MAG: GDSL-type esterase/lipase family protein [Myxococcota bacterium]